MRDDVRQVAEGVANVDQRLDGVEQRLDRFEEKMEAGFTETRAAIPLFLRTGRPADSGARRQLRRFERAGGAPRVKPRVIRGPRSHRCRNAFSRSTRIASRHSRLTMPIVQGPSSVVTWSSEIMRPMRCLAQGASVCRMCESCLGTHVPHYGDLPLIPVRRTCRVSPLSQRRSPSDKPEMRFRTNVPRYILVGGSP